MVSWLTTLVRAPRFLSLAVALGGILLLFGVAAAPVAKAASSRYLMCGWTVAARTQSVYIDPGVASTGATRAQVLGAFDSWNRLFIKYHGFPIFAEHTGPKSTADVVIDARTYNQTWVNGVCNPGYLSAGRSHTTLFLGAGDRWRNAAMIAHELGHALGLSDHGADAEHAAGHIGYQSCSNYLGVMSYCAGAQTWFLDIKVNGLYLDGQLVRDYWR